MEKKDRILEADDVYFTYEDGTPSLKGVSLVIERGKKIAFMGANGSGKSTFFLCCNGIHRPDKGVIRFHGEEVAYTRKGLLRLREKVGIVFQDPDNQLFSASVRQEISFGALNIGMDEEEAREAVDRVIGELEITPFQDRPTHALSGGQKKQVSIADILVMRPEIIILDEPAAALDPRHTHMVHRIVERLTQEGITVIMATHDMDYAYGWADEIVLMHDGKVLCQGTPAEVCDYPEALRMTNLTEPAVRKLFRRMCEKGILSTAEREPRTVQELEQRISAL